MGKKPLNEQQVKTLRKLVKDNPLHELLLNLSVDLMLRSSDLLSLRVKDVMNESGSVKTEWMKKLGVEDVSEYSTHSMRKTKPSVIYDKTHNVDAVRRLLGQSSVTATSAYLGVSDNSALELARTINI